MGLQRTIMIVTMVTVVKIVEDDTIYIIYRIYQRRCLILIFIKFAFMYTYNIFYFLFSLKLPLFIWSSHCISIYHFRSCKIKATPSVICTQIYSFLGTTFSFHLTIWLNLIIWVHFYYFKPSVALPVQIGAFQY